MQHIRFASTSMIRLIGANMLGSFFSTYLKHSMSLTLQ
nr:unnamed protein product [Callosobruchus analis]